MVTNQTNIIKAITLAAINAVKSVVQIMVVATREGTSGTRNEPRHAEPKFSRPPLR